jgi:hypothetical protein
MNAHHARALAGERQAELHREAATHRMIVSSRRHDDMRHRVGMLLVELGLHLIARGEPRPSGAISSPLAR